MHPLISCTIHNYPKHKCRLIGVKYTSKCNEIEIRYIEEREEERKRGGGKTYALKTTRSSVIMNGGSSKETMRCDKC